MEDDEQKGNRYTCTAYNSELRSLNQGEDKVIKPYGSNQFFSLQTFTAVYFTLFSLYSEKYYVKF